MPHFTALVTLLIGAYLLATGLFVGRTRRKTGIRAPQMSGDPAFERAIRIQSNAIEWVPIVMPALWLFALYVSDPWAAALGLVWIAGRIVYLLGYAKAADQRGRGFLIQGLAVLVLWFGAFAGIVSALLKAH